MESIFDVARYFLAKTPMNHKKLEKLCYYAQAWHLALYGQPLMNTWFEAWAHGPVSPELYNRYRDWGGLRILSNDGIPQFQCEDTISFLEKIFRLYGEYSGDELEDFTHEEEPWIKARGNYPPGAVCRNEILDDEMENYYKGLLEE
ncbi:MAG: DUF4065 domain-containing protein [Roseburia sp.]|nr:DUF4065 domain-containing protein [Roseburia sp.]